MRTRKDEYRYDLYLNAFHNTVNQYAEAPNIHDRKMHIKRAVFYGVKAIILKEKPKYITRQIAELNFQFGSTIRLLIGLLTPSEFMTIFPIEKEYNGHKWGFKDYFYTRDYINTLDPSKPIGQEEALHFIWEYHNWDITEFNVELMGYLSDLRQLEGYPSLAEEWAEMNGIETHTVHEDDKGNTYIIKDGKTLKLGKPRPRHLRVVK